MILIGFAGDDGKEHTCIMLSPIYILILELAIIFGIGYGVGYAVCK